MIGARLCVSLGGDMRVVCLLFLTILASEAPGQTRWDHNGSIVTLHADGSKREFRYAVPRAGLSVTSGTVLFTGKRDDGTYSGWAYIFSSRCGARPYQVTGTVAEDQRSVSMEGKAPIVDGSCMVVGFREDVLFFNLIEPNAATSSEALAQSTFGNLCPLPGRWVQGRGGMMCQCPDGSFLSLGQACRADDRAEREAALKYQQYHAITYDQYVKDWRECIVTASTEAQISYAISACDNALRYEQISTEDHRVLLSRRSALNDALAALKRQRIQHEQEEARRREFQRNAELCQAFNVAACNDASNSHLATQDDRRKFSAFALAAQTFRERVAACRAGSAIACDHALSAAAASPVDKIEIQRLRTETSYFERAKAIAVPAVDGTTQAAKRMWESVSNAVPNQYALDDVPRSTMIAGAVALVLAIALGFVLFGKGIDFSALFGKRGERLTAAVMPGMASRASDGALERSGPLNTTPHSLVIAARAREVERMKAEQVDDAKSEKPQTKPSPQSSPPSAAPQTSGAIMRVYGAWIGGLGLIGVLGSFLWWSAFYDKVGHTMPGAHALCLYNCNPSEANARSVFEFLIKKEFRDVPSNIVSFKKTNGAAANLGPFSMYELHFEATVELPSGANHDCNPSAPRSELSKLGAMGRCVGNNIEYVAPGTKRLYRDIIRFRKTERGWQAEDGRIY